MESTQAGETFTEEQKEYLQGFFAGVTARTVSPFVGQLTDGRFTVRQSLIFASKRSGSWSSMVWKSGANYWPMPSRIGSQIRRIHFGSVIMASSTSRPLRTLSCCVAGCLVVNSRQNNLEVCRRSQKTGERVMPISRPERTFKFERLRPNTLSKSFSSCTSSDSLHGARGLTTFETLLPLQLLESIRRSSSTHSHTQKGCTIIFSTIGIFTIFRANLTLDLMAAEALASLPILTTSGLSRSN
jgi:hypothetical protein